MRLRTCHLEREQIDGFVDNVRYGSLTRDGVLPSLSGWRDESAWVRWRTQATHHGVQEKGRTWTQACETASIVE